MRRKKAKTREILPDPRFLDPLVTQFVNNMMLDGKKSVAYSAFYDAIDIVSEKSGEDGLDIFKKAIANVTPMVEVRSRRVGGATFQIPQPVREDRKLALAIKWMILFSRKRNEKSMHVRLANEIMAAANEEGGAYKKKEDTHRMADANRAFSHFRF